MTGSTPSASTSEAPLDVQVLQTAASLENLVVGSYATAARLPFVVNGNARLRDLVARNKAHHAAHAQAFNLSVRKAGGAEQQAADPRYSGSVGGMLAAMKDPVSLVGLLTELEDIVAQTCTRYAILAATGGVRSLFATVAPVEAQHGAELLIMRALLDDGRAGADATATQARALPAAVGTAGIPQAVYSTADASAINEGAVR
jgi:hypothetical protein